MTARWRPRRRASGADAGRTRRIPLVMLGNASRLVDLIRSENISLVHARSRAPAFAALWAARTTRTPFVATYHGVYKAQSSLKRWYNAVMTRGDLVIANSEYTRAHVLAEHPHRPGQGDRHPTRRGPRPLQPLLGDAGPGRRAAPRLGDRRGRHAHPLSAGRTAHAHQGPPDDHRGRAPDEGGRSRRFPDPLRRRRSGPHRVRRRAGEGHRRGGPGRADPPGRALRRHAGGPSCWPMSRSRRPPSRNPSAALRSSRRPWAGR